MKKKKTDIKEKDAKKLTIMENKVKVSSATGFVDFDLSAPYYLMYFVEMNIIALFKGDYSKKKKIELPYMIIRIKSLMNVNFRIPQKLNDIYFEFLDNDKSLSFKFQDESVKDELGNKLKKLIKDVDRLKTETDNNYTDIELKYKIAKILESMDFESYRDNYDYRRFLTFDYLNKFNQMYNNTSDEYKYFYNRLYMGKLAIINKKSNLIRKEIWNSED